MGNTTEHTKGEWYVSNTIQDDGAFVYTKDNRFSAIARCYPRNETVKSLEEATANAERIVKCVNAHDSLVAALEGVLAKLKEENNFFDPTPETRLVVDDATQILETYK